MAELLQPVEDRFTAVLCEGRGVDGSLGTAAQLASIPAGYLRVAADRGDLRDAAYPGEQFDRAVYYEWASSEDMPGPNQPYVSVLLENYTLRVLVGYVYGVDAAAFVATTGTEVAATQVKYVRRRALSDARRFKVALEQPDLVRGGTDPTIVQVLVKGAGELLDLGGGRLVLPLTLQVTLQSDRFAPYTP